MKTESGRPVIALGGLDAEVSIFLFYRNIFWTFQPFRRILGDRAAQYQGAAPLGRARLLRAAARAQATKNSGGRKCRLKR
jgi:hypothetical protein